MSPPDLPDPLAAARAYQEGIVPSLMEEWPPRLLAAAGIRPGQRVLDVACGTGVLARAVKEAVGPHGSVTGIDIDAGMLAVAQALGPDIEWFQASADALPFPSMTFDAVVSQFGLMFFPDAPRALREMWRVLKPGGSIAVAVWGSIEDTPAYEAEARLVEARAGPAASAPLRRPFRLGEHSLLEDQFTQADIRLTSVSTVVGHGRFPSIRAMVEADVVGWLPLMGITLPPATVATILREAEDVLAPYRQRDGSAVFDSPAHIAVAVRGQ